VRCVLFACVYVCVWVWVFGYELVICICIQDNINIVQNQFGSANQRYCALPHHSSTFGLTRVDMSGTYVTED